MKRLLYIAYFFPPLGGAGVQRSLKFARYLPDHGWHPTVLTGAADYWLRDDRMLRELDPSIEVHRVRAWGGRFLGAGARKSGGGESSSEPRSGSGPVSASSGAPRSAARISRFRKLARWVCVPDAYLGWAWPAQRQALALAKPSQAGARAFDAVLTTSSPDSAHLIGRTLRRRLGVPWIADLRDPWVRRLSYAAPTPLHDAWQTRLERQCLEEADSVVVTSEATREDYLQRLPGLDPTRVHVITNGYDESDFAEAAELLDRDPGPEAGWPADVLHAGQLNPDRPIGPFLDGFRRFLHGGKAGVATNSGGRKNTTGPQALFLGGHYDRDLLEVSQRGLDGHVSFRDNVSHAASIASLQRARVLLLLEQDSDRGRLILPGKVFEYLRARRPILALVPRDGAADRLVRTMDAGRVVEPSDPARIAEGLEALLQAPGVTGEPGPDHSLPDTALGQFERRELTARLARVLDGLARD